MSPRLHQSPVGEDIGTAWREANVKYATTMVHLARVIAPTAVCLWIFGGGGVLN